MNQIIVELMNQIETIYQVVVDNVDGKVIVEEPPTSFSFNLWFKDTAFGLHIAIPFKDGYCETSLLTGTAKYYQWIYDGTFGYHESKVLTNQHELVQEIKLLHTLIAETKKA